MEISHLHLGFVLLLILWAMRFLERFWRRPKRLEHALRVQGLKGIPYRFPFGDVKQFLELRKEALARSMSLSHDIIPCVSPYIQCIMSQYGKISFTWIEQEPVVILNDPEIVRYDLTKQRHIFLKPKLKNAGKLLLTGLGAHEGEKWVKHRRIINTVFHLKRLKLMLPAFSTSCDELISKWDKLIGSKEFTELDVLPECKVFAGDVISRSAFGSSFEEGCRIFELQQELCKLVVKASQNYYIPFYKYLPSKMNMRMKAVNCEMETILRDMIEQREDAIRKGEVTSNDLLGILLESNIRDSQKGGIKNAMTTKDVIDECKLFYIAGHETNAAALTWALVLLSMHSEWQDRAREEVLNLFGRAKPDYNGLNQLKIVTMIINEVLRLYPSGTNIIERIAADEVQIGEITYPPRVHFLLPSIFLHHDPEFWGPDANEFNPERFSEGILKASVQGAFLPFGAGPRFCIGQNFSLLELKLCLVRILQVFRFELSPTYAHAPYDSVTMQTQYGAQIIIHRC